MDAETQKRLLDLVKRNYEEIAGDFIQTRQKVIWPELSRLADMVKRGDSVLDAGCGNGRLLQVFRLKPVRYVGLDYNYRFIEFARSSWAVPDGKFIYGDILELDKNPELKEQFDFVFCVAVIHNIPGAELRAEALRQMAAKLKPEGKIILSAWYFWNKPKYLKRLAAHTISRLFGKNNMDWGDIIFNWGNQQSKRYYHVFTKKGLVRLSREAGLRVDKAYRDKYNYYLILKKA